LKHLKKKAELYFAGFMILPAKKRVKAYIAGAVVLPGGTVIVPCLVIYDLWLQMTKKRKRKRKPLPAK
jgi:hypothetical protein